MTEKRYKLHHNYNFGYGVEDTYNSDRLYLDEFELLVDELNALNDENEQLKQELSEEGIQIDFLEAENQHMINLVNENEQLKKDREELFIRERDTKNEWRDVKQENEQLKKDKDVLIDYIKKEFPKSHKHILEGFE